MYEMFWFKPNYDFENFINLKFKVPLTFNKVRLLINLCKIFVCTNTFRTLQNLKLRHRLP